MIWDRPTELCGKAYGVKCGKHEDLVCSINHPVVKDDRLWFVADPPHLLKNLKCMLVRNKYFTIAEDIVRRNNLNHNTVSLAPVRHLIEIQANKHLKLAPRLSANLIDQNHFDKMNVAQAVHFFSKSVTAGIRFIVEQAQQGDSELSKGINKDQQAQYLTTAWFFDQVRHWFDLMSSRHPSLGLSKVSSTKYEELTTSLRHFIYLIKNISIGTGAWKPVQSGILLATTSVLQIADNLLSSHSFLLTGRLSQDCLENLFSSVRYRNPNPTPREFRYALKTITIAQFLTISASSNYDKDDRQYIAEFLDTSCSSEVSDQADDVLLSLLDSEEQLSQDEANSLYYLAGYTLQSVKKQGQTCEECFSAAKDNDRVSGASNKPVAYTSLREFKNVNFLCYVNDAVYNQFVLWEQVVRDQLPHIKSTPNIAQRLYDNCMLHTELSLPPCHSLVNKLCRKFLNARLHFYAKKLSKDRSVQLAGALGSKSTGMRLVAKNIK